MVLLRQLLGTECESASHLACQVGGVGEAEGVKEYLRNQTVVGNHHCDWSEKCLQVVRQLLPAGLSRVHGDVDVECVNNFDFSLQKHARGFPFAFLLFI